MATKVCPVCGRQFSPPKASNARIYCSEACKVKGAKQKAALRRLRRGHAGPETRRELAGRPYVLTAKDCKLCRTCKYRAKGFDSGLVTCDYLIETGEPRGCDVSEHCERYERGKGKGQT